MHEHPGPSRWAGALLAVLLAALVGAWTYNLGLAHGLATQLPDSAAGPYPWAFYRPWGLGFPFFPLSFLLFWFVAARIFLRGGPRRGGWGGYYGGGGRGVPPMFEEWHRRAHEQDPRPAPTTPAQG
jgi:hypothetical protein